MRKGLILSLCDETGNWPRPYAEAGYEVRLIDLKHGQDVRLLELPTGPVTGILADALEDAGCRARTILDHCRGVGMAAPPGLHARGCWALDLLLGRS